MTDPKCKHCVREFLERYTAITAKRKPFLTWNGHTLIR